MNSDPTFRDYSMFVGKKQGDDWYEWCVFAGGDRETLLEITSIEYALHPSFPNPIRRITDRATRFALFSSGWGGFRIGIDVEWRDGSHTRFEHFLKLAGDDWPIRPEPPSFANPETEAVYQALFHDKFRWRKAETVARATRIAEARVAKILHQLSDQDLVRRASFLSFEKKELWAPTVKVGITPRL
jgi:transcription initiation factor IIF auxiliary subunit